MSRRKIEWTPEMNALLLRERAKTPPASWRKVAGWLGVNVDTAQGRHKALTGESEQPRVAAKAPDVVEDGLGWMIRKGRLTKARAEMAVRYREAFRDGGAGSMKSCLDVSVGGGTPGPGRAGAAFASHTDAQRQLFRWRHLVLRSQTDMLTVMDGVCGLGWSPRRLAGGNGHRANELETVLGIALDLMIDAEKEGVRKAA